MGNAKIKQYARFKLSRITNLKCRQNLNLCSNRIRIKSNMFNVGLTEMRLVLMCDGGSGVCQEEKKQMLKTKRSVKTERERVSTAM